MEKYNDNAPCKKCGSHRISTELFQNHSTTLMTFDGEAMKRECQNCKRVWFEKPLDQVEG